jgi:hypothetical protein
MAGKWSRRERLYRRKLQALEAAWEPKAGASSTHSIRGRDTLQTSWFHSNSLAENPYRCQDSQLRESIKFMSK